MRTALASEELSKRGWIPFQPFQSESEVAPELLELRRAQREDYTRLTPKLRNDAFYSQDPIVMAIQDFLYRPKRDRNVLIDGDGELWQSTGDVNEEQFVLPAGTLDEGVKVACRDIKLESFRLLEIKGLIGFFQVQKSDGSLKATTIDRMLTMSEEEKNLGEEYLIKDVPGTREYMMQFEPVGVTFQLTDPFPNARKRQRKVGVCLLVVKGCPQCHS